MKMILRLIVVLVVALFIFTGGFWLGNKWKGQENGSSTEEVTASLPGGSQEKTVPATEGQAVGGQAAEDKTGAPAETVLADKKAGDSAGEQNQAGAAKESTPPETITTAAKEPSPGKPAGAEPPSGKEAPVQPVKEVKSAAPQAQAAKQETPVPASAPSPATPPQPAPAGAPGKKDAPPAIVTPQDLGQNQITYSVQTGAFLDRTHAENQMEMLKAKKYPAFIVSAWDGQKQLWHTVRVGRFTDIMEARKAAETLQLKERISARVYGLGSLQFEEPPAPATIPGEQSQPAAPKAAVNGVPEKSENSG